MSAKQFIFLQVMRNQGRTSREKSKPPKMTMLEPTELELKPLPSRFKYVFHGKNNTLPIIIKAHLNNEYKLSLLQILIGHKKDNRMD